jgi:IMP dehydrogenase
MELGQSFCFDDVLMEPLLSNISSRSSISLETNIGINGRSLMLKTPLISSPMDTVTETDMAIKMALNGGLGIIHRYMSIEDQVAQVTKVKRYLQYIITEPYKLLPTATFDEIEKLRDLYNVSSFCVVDTNNTLLGIITRRDLEYMKYYERDGSSNSCVGGSCIINNNLTVAYFMNTNIIKIDIMSSMNGYIQQNPVENTYESILKISKQLMLQHKIEKIPIVKGSTLIGLVTLKNIRHYENNKSKACVDANGALCVGASVGIVGDYLLRLEQLVGSGVDLICIDVANGFNENVFNVIKIIRDKYPTLILMVGNVCNWQGYAALTKFDVDCIRIGVGNGSICTTRLETGIGKGQFSAVAECFRYKIANNALPHIICDGGSLGKNGNKVKALACGSSAVMLGRTLSSTEESPGSIIYRNGKRFKYIRGMASSMASLSKEEKTGGSGGSGNNKRKSMHSEGVDGEQELSGSVVDVLEQINGGLKSGMSYLGCENIKQLHGKNAKGEIKFNLVTSIGMTETGIRVKTY